MQINRPQLGFKTYTAVFSICCKQMCFPPYLAQFWAHSRHTISTCQWNEDIQYWVFSCVFQHTPATFIKFIESQPKSLMIKIRIIRSLLIKRLNGKTVFKFSENGQRKQNTDGRMCSTVSDLLIPQKGKKKKKTRVFTGCIIWT